MQVANFHSLFLNLKSSSIKNQKKIDFLHFKNCSIFLTIMINIVQHCTTLYEVNEYAIKLRKF